MKFSPWAIKKAQFFYTYKGERLSIKALAKKYGLVQNTLEHRIRSGMTIAQAIEAPVRKREQYLYEGKMYTLTELAHKSKLDRNCLRYRINKMGMTVKEAVETPSAHHGDGFPTVAQLNKNKKSTSSALKMYATTGGRCNAK